MIPETPAQHQQSSRTIDHDQLIAKCRETIDKTRSMLEQTQNMLRDYERIKAKRVKRYTDVKCGVDK